MKNKPTITAVVITHNEETMIANCLETLQWCDEIIVVDTGSSDSTVQIAEAAGARVIAFANDSFARIRNEGLKRTKTNWVFYVDADERVTPQLYQEIRVHIELAQVSALSMKRENIILGKQLKHGGWQKDVVTRVFKREQLEGWRGKVHERPIFEGSSKLLNTPLIHLTHRSIRDGLVKTVKWTQTEAELLAAFKAKSSSKVNFFTIVKKGVAEFLRRAVARGGYKDGMPGLIEALIQMINKMLIYMQVWESQEQGKIKSQYRELEKQIFKQWQQHNTKNK